MTTYFYIRVSSLDQAQKGLSLDTQNNIAKSLGITEKNIYIDGGKSGGVKEDEMSFKVTENVFITYINISHRQAFKELLGKLQEGDTIKFTRWDRLARNITLLNNIINWCEQKGIILEAVNDTNEPLVRNIMIVLSEEEINKIKIRNEAIQENLFKNKNQHPFRCPYGFRKKDKMIIPIPSEVALIRQIYALHEAGKDITSISKELGEHYKKIQRILSHSAFYKGYITYKGETKKGTHEKII
jgi:DNA invertase Pin-like site-specific DNA recombinase